MNELSIILVLSLTFGAIVGLSLGLTGGGGAIFAVPLLVYGLRVPAAQAVGVSLAAVGATSLVGFLHRWRLGEVELQTGVLFALAGMLGAPIGSWISGQVSSTVLMLSFAALMLVVAVRMWRGSQRVKNPAAANCDAHLDAPTCRRDDSGRLILSSRCAVLLLVLGLATGVLSGLFGVGGGFVIVPALVLFSGMSMHAAVGTSLMVIALVSVSGVSAHLWAGRSIDPLMTGIFVAGGVAGLLAGQRLGRRLSGPALQRTFAAAIVLVAAYVLFRNLYLA